MMRIKTYDVLSVAIAAVDALLAAAITHYEYNPLSDDSGTAAQYTFMATLAAFVIPRFLAPELPQAFGDLADLPRVINRIDTAITRTLEHHGFFHARQNRFNS